jgi:choline dehydrogenase-like flavoprotein
LSAAPSSPEAGATLDTDVCIIGSGPAGIALARELADSPLRVLVLESGGEGPDPATSALNGGDNSGDRPIDLDHGRQRSYGGTGKLWAGQCLRLAAEDFAVRPWVPHSGWPIGLADLVPFYERAEQVLGVPGEAAHDGPSLYGRVGLSPLPVDPALLGHLASVYMPSPDVGGTYRGTLERAANIRLELGTTVTRIVADPSHRQVTHIEARARRGGLTITARAYVLCAGGIENARLLLVSNLGNDHDLVGRFLMDHPNGRAGTIETEQPRTLHDRFGLLYRRPFRYYPKLRLTAGVQQRERVLNSALMINADFGVEGIEAARRLIRAARRGRLPRRWLADLSRIGLDAPSMAYTAYRRYARGLSPTSRDSITWLQTYAEQAPNRSSRVRLSERRDALGVPLPHVEWRFTDLDARTARVMVATVAAELARLGVGRVVPAAWLDAAGATWFHGIHDAYHPSGTTRMSADPAAGVVDAACRVHGVERLYVAGSSVFPTVGFANPTLTIVALAIRLADHLKGALTASHVGLTGISA